MKRPIIIYSFIVLMGFIFLQCGSIDEDEKIVQPKYHTASNEGLWIDKSDTHVPIITVTGKDTIDVQVPLKPSKRPLHYIEAIVLVDGSREIESKSISFSLNVAHAQFKLPDPEKGQYKIVVKCNLHDMWMAPVLMPKKK